MKILGQSQAPTTNLFLHIGYISANPRSYRPYHLQSFQKELIVLDQDLTLQNPAVVEAPPPDLEYPRDRELPFGLPPSPDLAIMGWVTLFFLGSGWYLRRQAGEPGDLGGRFRAGTDAEPVGESLSAAGPGSGSDPEEQQAVAAEHGSKARSPQGSVTEIPVEAGSTKAPQRLRWPLALLLLGLLALPVHILSTPVNGGKLFPHPDRGRFTPYADPKRATRAIMEGLLADSIRHSPLPMQSLGDLRGQMALPAAISRLTPGVRQALQHYGLDGWGRAFRFAGSPDPTGPSAEIYRITSAGPDGSFGTADDLSSEVRRVSDRSIDWERRIKGVYLQTAEKGTRELFIRRVQDSFFRYQQPEKAAQLTGTNLFDLIFTAAINDSDDDSTSLKTMLVGYKAAGYLYKGSDNRWTTIDEDDPDSVATATFLQRIEDLPEGSLAYLRLIEPRDD